MKRKIPSVTVATVVHEEEQKITEFLNSLSLQSQDSFVLRKILIYADGSDKKTRISLAKNRTRKLKIIFGRKQLGTTTRLNEIICSCKTDILVFLDINSVLKDRFVIENLIQPFILNPDTALVGGNPKPLPPNTFIEKATQSYFHTQEVLKKTLEEEGNIYGVNNKIFAISKSLFRKTKVPPSLECFDKYLYLKCKTEKYNFAHKESAVIYFRLPKNVEEILNLIKAAYKDVIQLKMAFPPNVIKQELSIEFKTRLRLLASHIINNPVGFLTITALNLYTEGKKYAADARLAKQRVSTHKLPRLLTQ